MRRTTYNKLVRDRIPEIIRSKGAVPHIRALSPKEYRTALLKKLREEAAELAATGPEKQLDELVDVLEVGGLEGAGRRA